MSLRSRLTIVGGGWQAVSVVAAMLFCGPAGYAVGQVDPAALERRLRSSLGSGSLEVERDGSGNIVAMRFRSDGGQVPARTGSRSGLAGEPAGREVDLRDFSSFAPEAGCRSEAVSLSCTGPRFTGAITSVLTMGQSFTATSETLTAVELAVAVLGDVPVHERADILIQLREDAPDGPIISQSSLKVFGPTDTTLAGTWIRFPFPSALSLTPGAKYYLEVDLADGDSMLSDRSVWLMTNTSAGCQEFGGDYPDGEFCIDGICHPSLPDVPFRIVSCDDPHAEVLEDLVEAGASLHIADALHDCRCVPPLFLPEASGGHFEAAKALVADWLASVTALGDPDLVDNLGKAEKCRELADSAELEGRYNLACKALSTTVQLLSEPPNTGRGAGRWNGHAADKLCLKKCTGR